MSIYVLFPGIFNTGALDAGAITSVSTPVSVPTSTSTPTSVPVSSSTPSVVSVTQYQFYRINATSAQDGVNYNFNEVYFYDGDPTTTGQNRVVASVTPGTPLQSSTGGFGDIANVFNRRHGQADFAGASWVSQSGAIPAFAGWTGTSVGQFDFVRLLVWPRGSETSRAPRDFTIEYSDDGSVWNVALSVSNETSWTEGVPNNYTWNTVGGARDWRLRATATNGDSFLGLARLLFSTSSGDVSLNNDGNAGTWAFPDGNPLVGLNNANDGVSSADLANTGSGVTSAVMPIAFPAPFSLHTFGYTPFNGKGFADFTIEGSNDLSNWEVLISVEGDNPTSGIENRFEVSV